MSNDKGKNGVATTAAPSSPLPATHCVVCGIKLDGPISGRHDKLTDHCEAHGEIWTLIKAKEKVF